MARKQFKIDETSKKKLVEFAALSGVSVANVLGQWIRSFVKHGSDYAPPEMVKVETQVPADILEKAEAIAEANGHSLRDMILFEISEIDKL